MRIDHRELAEHQFAVLNPLQIERSQWMDLRTVGLIPTTLPDKAAAMPRLLDLTALDPGQQIALLERADAWDTASDFPFLALLLKSNAPIRHVAAYLVRQLVIRAPDESAALLRWYDPLVFRHLHWLLTPAQVRTLSGPVTSWCWRQTFGDWRSCNVHTCERANVRLRVTPEQWATMGRLGVLNRTIAQLGRNMPELTFSEDLSRQVDACLQQAYDHQGLTEEADARLFVEQAIRNPRLHQRPDVEKRLERARKGDVTYVGGCADLDLDTVLPNHRHIACNARML